MRNVWVFTTVQNFAEINAAVLIINNQVFMIHKFGFNMPIHAPLGDLNPKWGGIPIKPPKDTSLHRKTLYDKQKN